MNKLSNYRSRIDAVIASKVSKEKIYWKLVAQRKTNHAYEYAFRVPVGYSAQDIEKNILVFNAACGAEIELVDRKGVVIFKVYKHDFPKVIPFKLDMTQQGLTLLGFDRSRKPVYHSFQTNPHLMIAGMSGYGKTDLLRLIIYQLLSDPKTEIIIVDMKGFSFMPFLDIPQIKEVATDLISSYKALTYAVNEMLRREELVRQNRNRSIIQSFHPIVVIIDEAIQIAPKLEKNKSLKKIAELCDSACAKIATKGREPKVSLIYCTQRPDHEVINGQVKANMDANIALRTKNEVNSRIILDRSGAELLPQKTPGRAIYSSTSDVTMQIPYVGNDDAWNKLLAPLKTEVLNYGQSERRTKEPHIVDVSDDSPSDNRTDCQVNISGKRITVKTSVGTATGNGEGKNRRGQKIRNDEKNMAALPQRKITTRGWNDTDTVEYDET